ncbi:MAG: hypothetical protein ACI4GW_01845 [Lachnospiraceae bacterium]
MGFFDKIGDIIKIADKAVNNVEDKVETTENIVIASSYHTVKDDFYGDGDSKYIISFQLNDSFKEAQSHAGEVEMLNTYAPFDEYGEEGTYPYVAMQLDDKVYDAVSEFKEKGTFTGGIEIIPLTNHFYFKAKMEYYGYMMYFYGLDRCDGSWENNGLCIVYPKKYVGTENERVLMNVLDEAAESYSEERKS